jgi:hypothetical protein
MPLDIQFAYPQQIIKISQVSLLQERDPPTLLVVGDDFSAVDEVLLNDVPSPAVTVLSKTELTAVLPVEVRGNSVVTVTVVSYRLVHSDNSVVSFRFGPTNRKTSGINRLMQLFLKILLTSPGSDIFSPQLGGGVLDIVGRSFSRSEVSSLVGDLVVAVDNTAKQVIAIQSRKARLPRDERLLSAQVQSAEFDASQTALIATVNLTSQAGTAATANILL